MAKSYLVITEVSDSEFAVVCDTHSEAVGYINEAIDEWRDIVFEVREEARNVYSVILHGGKILKMSIRSYDTAAVKYHLLKYEHEQYIETRRFSSRERAVNFVKREIDKYDYNTDEDEDEGGSWQLSDEEEDLDIKFVLLVVIIDSLGPHNHYRVLGVDENATESEIKVAYRRRAKECHPDAGGDAERFQEVQNAYQEVLRRGASARSSSPSEAYLSGNVRYFVTNKLAEMEETAESCLLDEARSVAKRKIYTGVAWMVGGITLSAATYSASSASGGDQYVMFYGAIGFGVWSIMRGLVWFIYPRALVNKAMRNLK